MFPARFLSRLFKLPLLSGLPLCLYSSSVLFAATVAAESASPQQALELYTRLNEAQAEYTQLLTSGSLDASEQADYLAWIESMRSQLAQKCRTLANAQTPSPTGLPCERYLSTGNAAANIDLKTEITQDENTARLLGQLDSSLGEFDETLLQEQARIKAQKPRDDTSQANSSDAGGDGGGDGNDGSAQSATQNGQTRSTEQSDNSEQQQGRGTSGQAQTTGASGPGNSGQKTSKTGTATPDDIPDGRDDDIVARQLREAAERETDPELKKKLWDEYRRYKTGTNQ